MALAVVSREDKAALEWLLGGVVAAKRAARVAELADRPIVIETPAAERRVLDEYEAIDSKGNPRTVELRRTKNGTDEYWFCSCPGWRFQMGKGRTCAHCSQAIAATGRGRVGPAHPENRP